MSEIELKCIEETRLILLNKFTLVRFAVNCIVNQITHSCVVITPTCSFIIEVFIVRFLVQMYIQKFPNKPVHLFKQEC